MDQTLNINLALLGKTFKVSKQSKTWTQDKIEKRKKGIWTKNSSVKVVTKRLKMITMASSYTDNSKCGSSVEVTFC